MPHVTELSASDAKQFFLKETSYFRNDLPKYLSFQPIIDAVSQTLGNGSYSDFLGKYEDPESGKTKPLRPNDSSGVNYSFTANKDGRFAWRPYELIHPAIYVSLINQICTDENWQLIVNRFNELHQGVIECCSIPSYSDDHQSDAATQVKGWWLEYEQKSIELSLDFSHMLQTDVTDCYGSLYTHSIVWALHGIEAGKDKKNSHSLLGNKIDQHIQASRFGQTNGISQGSVLMDLFAELVLSYVDAQIDGSLKDKTNIRILRYRDDYRIFSNSDSEAEETLKIISDSLRNVGMRLGAAKTSLSSNVVEAAIKPDKRAGIELRDMDITQAKSFQKQLLRLHSFGLRFPNSGALKRLASEYLERMKTLKEKPDDLKVQVAIVTDIALTSPQAFPALSGIASHLISYATGNEKNELWNQVKDKMRRIPYNGYLEVWLQRLTKPLDIDFKSEEPICKAVNGEEVALWNNDWIGNENLIKALDSKKILISAPSELQPEMDADEVKLFTSNAEFS